MQILLLLIYWLKNAVCVCVWPWVCVCVCVCVFVCLAVSVCFVSLYTWNILIDIDSVSLDIMSFNNKDDKALLHFSCHYIPVCRVKSSVCDCPGQPCLSEYDISSVALTFWFMFGGKYSNNHINMRKLTWLLLFFTEALLLVIYRTKWVWNHLFYAHKQTHTHTPYLPHHVNQVLKWEKVKAKCLHICQRTPTTQ